MNTQINEDYVSFEVAKLLKEKGFDDEYTNAFYDKTGNLYFIDLLSDLSMHPNNDTDIAASTLYVAMKWLREVHKIHIDIFIGCDINNEDTTYWTYFIVSTTGDMIYNAYGDDINFVGKSYEQTCEVAIEYSLTNLI